ncbi:hypothetical protein AGMMS50293_27080 [Spirochaetia bacterium]|nr:hypothetical protein AGMMS50293_27080 [Spirochaetia bacterium]
MEFAIPKIALFPEVFVPDPANKEKQTTTIPQILKISVRLAVMFFIHEYNSTGIKKTT